MQVTTSSSSLFSSLTGASSEAPAPQGQESATMGLVGHDMAAPSPLPPSTLVGYNKPLRVEDTSFTYVGHTKPLLLDAANSASAHTSLNQLPPATGAAGTVATSADKATAPGTAAAHSTAPKADTMEIAALELLHRAALLHKSEVRRDDPNPERSQRTIT